MRRLLYSSILIILSMAVPMSAFEPSSTSPYTFTGTDSCSTCETFAHTRVGDGNWHAPGCGQSGAPLYFCDCSIGYSPGEMLQPPVLRVDGSNVELEYYARNAYCNPPADGGNINEPLSIPFRININEIDPETFGFIRTAHVVPPYWEHGKVTFTDLNPGCKMYRAVYIVMSTSATYAVSSNVVGGTGSSSSGLPCLNDTNSCPIGAFGNGGPPQFATQGLSPSTNRPINIGSGNMQYSERLFSVDEPVGSFDFTITYNSRDTTVGPLGIGFLHPFAQTLNQVPSSSARLWRGPNGERVLFVLETHPPVGDIWRPVYPGDALGTATRNTSTDTYTFRDLANNSTVIKSHGSNYTVDSMGDRWGNTYSTTYSGSNLTQITDSLGRVWTLAYSGSLLTSITDNDSNQWRFTYDSSNRLTAIFDPLHTGSTPWRQFTWVTYDSSKPAVMAAVADESGAVLEGHQYDSAGRAISSWTGDTTGGSTPAPGTNARELVTITYTDDTHRTVTSSVQSGVSQASVYTLTASSGRFLATSIVGNCTACGTSVDAQTFTFDDSNRPLTRTVGLDLSGSGGTDERVTTTYAYDGNGQVVTRVDAAGSADEQTTTYAYGISNWPSFVTSITRASVAKSGQSAVTTFGWNTTGPVESVLTMTRSGYLKSSDTSATTYTTTSHFDTRHRLTETDGPGTNEKTTLAYYSDTDTTLDRRGRLQESRAYTSTSAYLPTTFDNYNVYGGARKQTDPNGVDTTSVTDARGRVTSTTSVKPTSDSNEPADYVASFTFDSRDRLTSSTRPRGNGMRYRYEDGSNRLLETIRIDTSGNEHERLMATLNTAGYKSTEAWQECPSPANPCASWTTRQSESFAYDAHARLATITHADATTVVNAYDSRGNMVSTKDERHTAANSLYAFDARNRLKRVTQKQTLVSGSDVVTQWTYDNDGNLTSATDANGNVTSYAFDDFGRMQSQASPVTGSTTYTYDATNNLVSTTDANGATTTRTFDALRRTLTASACSGSEEITWTYDDATAGRYGKGRIASMTDPSGSTDYSYERRGLLRNENRMIGSWSSSTDYAYDADGNRIKLGNSEYSYDFAGRPSAASHRDCPSCSAVSLVTSASYLPFGPEATLAFANGTTQTKSYDSRYRIAENKLTAGTTTLIDSSYTIDAVGNPTAIADLTDSTYNRAFAYDDLNRVTTANSGTSLWGSGAFTYDAMGNMLTLTLGSRTESFAYSGTTPKISTSTSQGHTYDVSYDAAGNEGSSVHVPVPASGEEVTYSALYLSRVYSCRNLMVEVSDAFETNCGTPPCPIARGPISRYAYDGRGVRVHYDDVNLYFAVTPVNDYVYTPELQLSLRHNILLDNQDEFVWLNGHPVAQISSDVGAPLYTFTDHLGTPIALTNGTAAVVWQAEYEPYGRVFQLRVDAAPAEQPLRLPGQEVAPHGGDDNYNIFRWYGAGWGRYAQSDPLEHRVEGVLNSYRYASSNPERYLDPTGLESTHKADRTNCLKNPIDCARVWKCKDQAIQVSKKKFGYEKDNTPQNAYKHCYWNCCMTKIIGATEAKKFGDAHEDYPGNDVCSKEMDLWNNEMGRMVLPTESCDNNCSNAPLQPGLIRPPCAPCRQSNPLNP
jgi:RHS repeat-associated protein